MGLLPTPNAADADHYSKTRITGSQAGSQLHALAVNGLLATPRSNNAPDLDLSNPNLAARRRGNLEEQLARSIQTDSRKTDGRTSLQLNPLFVEEMMGFPSMWTVSPFLIPSGDGSL